MAFLSVSDDGHILTPKWADVVMKKLGRYPESSFRPITTSTGSGCRTPFLAGGLEPALEWTKTHDHTLLDGHTLVLTPEKV